MFPISRSSSRLSSASHGSHVDNPRFPDSPSRGSPSPSYHERTVSRSSGFSKLLKHVSPMSRRATSDAEYTLGADRDVIAHSSPSRRSGLDDERHVSGISEDGVRRSSSLMHLRASSASSVEEFPRGHADEEPNTSAYSNTYRSHRASTASPLSTQEYRPVSRTESPHIRHAVPPYPHHQETSTPSPQTRYAPQQHVYTSSPSPLARRSESRQSVYSQAASSSSNNRPAAPESVHSLPSGDPYGSQSRARTPKPGDFREGDSFTSSDDEQSTTPRSEMKRWTPSVLGQGENRNVRYSSEPPLSSTTPSRHRTLREQSSQRLSLGLVHQGDDLEAEEKVENWRGNRAPGNDSTRGESVRRRSALPLEFRNSVTSPPRSHTAMSHYGQSSMTDSPHYASREGYSSQADPRQSPPSQYRHNESPFRRSESLDLRNVLEGRLDSQSPGASSIRRSVTLHGRDLTEGTPSPLRSRLGLGSVRSSRLAAAEEESSSQSPVDLQRAQSRRRRAALLNEMTSSPIRPATRLSLGPQTVTDTRPVSRMSGFNASGIRPSTSISSFRASDSPLASERLFRRDSVISTRPLSVAKGIDAWPPSPVPRSRHLAGQPPSRLERRSTGRTSPTKSTISSTVAPVGTPSRVVMNRLLVALRQSSGQDTQEMLHACIALQETMAEKAEDADVRFKQSCQTVATDANQINANLKAALDIVNQLSAECEVSSPEEAQIAAISATQKLADLIGNSSKASDEKIKSLQTMFDRLSNYASVGALPSGTEPSAPSVLPIVQEDVGQSDSEGKMTIRQASEADTEVVEKLVSPEVIPVESETSTDQGLITSDADVQPSQPSQIDAIPASDVEHDAAKEQLVDISPQRNAPSSGVAPQELEANTEDAPSVPLPSSAEITPEQVKTRARKASSSSICVSLSPGNNLKLTRSPVPPTLLHKASFMPSSLSLRTPTTALSRINAGSADEQGFDFDVKPKVTPVEETPLAEEPVEEPTEEHSVKEESSFRLNPLQLEIRTTPAAGRGVFATQDIGSRTVIEESPVLVLTRKEWDDGHLNDGVLGGYGFNWTAGGMGVGLGIASMFNHSPQPNVMFTRVAPHDSETNKYPKLIFRTTKPIKQGDELYICYSADESKLWFSPNYVVQGNTANQTAEEQEWLPPMVDNSAEAEEGTLLNADHAYSEKPSHPTKNDSIDVTTERDVTLPSSGSTKSDEQKYVDRKARRQSKREKKVKKPKQEDKIKEASLITVSGESCDTPPLGEETFADMDTTPSLSPSDCAAALAKLDLIPEIAIEADDIEREEAFAVDEAATAEDSGNRQDEVACRLVKRIRGLVEAQEEDEARTVDIWAVAIADKKLMPSVLKYLKLNEKRFIALDHVKRVNHQRDNGGTLVAIAPVALLSRESLHTELKTFDQSLEETEIIQTTVPATFARDLVDVAEKAKVWPVLMNAPPKNPADSPWTLPRKAWVRKGLKRLVELSHNALEAGELPVAAIASSAPMEALPSDPDLIPPTPNMRAGSTDRRKSLKHPLKHAAMGCVAEIARLRTQSPFTETMSSRNGADYLLTSLSLFITHEPCVMCTMALLHSRVKEIFFLVRNPEGGFGGAFAIHGHPGLNHKIDVYDCSRLVDKAELDRLNLPEGTEP